MSFGVRVPVDYGDGVARETAQIICDGCAATDNGGGLCPPDWTRIGGSGPALLHFCPMCSKPISALLRGLANVAQPMGSESREPEGGSARPLSAKDGNFATRHEALDAIAAGLRAASRFGVEAQRAAGAEIPNPETARVSFEVTLLELLAERRRKALPDAEWSDALDKRLARDPYAFLKKRDPAPASGARPILGEPNTDAWRNGEALARQISAKVTQTECKHAAISKEPTEWPGVFRERCSCGVSRLSWTAPDGTPLHKDWAPNNEVKP